MKLGLRLRPELYWYATFAVCFVAFQQVQDNFRLNYKGSNYFVKYFLGVAPNLFPAIGIPALFLVIIPQFGIKKNSKWMTSKKHVTSIFISNIGLILWEVMQQFTSKGRFDWHDILWTIIGSLIFYTMWSVRGQKFEQDRRARENLKGREAK